MPKQVYIDGIGFVRAGSWTTKPPYEQWRQTRKQLEDAEIVLIPRLRHLLFEDRSDATRYERELYIEVIVSQLESLRNQINKLLIDISKVRQIEMLENVTGRESDEARVYLEKALQLRKEVFGR